MGLFGRKKPGPGGGGDEGHQAVLHRLRVEEAGDPGIRERVAGGILFDLGCKLLADTRGVRIENLIAMLASVGGQQCIAPIIAAVRAGESPDRLGVVRVQGKDGQIYFFGDGPNRLLLESRESLISLAFGAAQALGAPVNMEMIQGEIAEVAKRVGGAEFELLELDPSHMVDRPSEWVRVFNGKMVEALDLYEVPPMRRATAIGYALQKAIEAGKDNLDPMMSATIVLQCATRSSKLLVGPAIDVAT